MSGKRPLWVVAGAFALMVLGACAVAVFLPGGEEVAASSSIEFSGECKKALATQDAVIEGLVARHLEMASAQREQMLDLAVTASTAMDPVFPPAQFILCSPVLLNEGKIVMLNLPGSVKIIVS